MVDIILVTVGAVTICYGLWIIYPPISMIVVGSVALAIAYGRYRMSKTGVIAPKQP